MMVLMKLITLFMIAHHLGDYYLQNGFLASKKSNSYFYTFIHCLIYAIPFLIIWFIFLEKDLFIFRYIFIMTILHVPVDICKCFLQKENDKLINKGFKILENTTLIYIIDQMIHIISIIVIIVGLYPYLKNMNLTLVNSLSFNLVCFILYFIIGYQVYYILIKKITHDDRTISNWYSYKDFKYKILSAFISSMMVKLEYTFFLLAVIYAIAFILRRKKKIFIYI